MDRVKVSLLDLQDQKKRGQKGSKNKVPRNVQVRQQVVDMPGGLGKDGDDDKVLDDISRRLKGRSLEAVGTAIACPTKRKEEKEEMKGKKEMGTC